MTKVISLLLVAIIFSKLSFAKTIQISGRTELTEAVTTIPEGVTWLIKPGAEIIVPPNGSIVVNGVLRARGSRNKAITFTAAKRSKWSGIKFVGRNIGAVHKMEQDSVLGKVPTVSNVLHYVNFKNLNTSDKPVIEIINANLFVAKTTVSNSTFIDYIQARDSSIVLTKTSLFCVTQDSTGIKAQSSVVYMDRTVSKGCSTVINVTNSVLSVTSGIYHFTNSFLTAVNSQVLLYQGTYSSGAQFASVYNSWFEATKLSLPHYKYEPFNLQDMKSFYISHSSIEKSDRCSIISTVPTELTIVDTTLGNSCISIWYPFHEINNLVENRKSWLHNWLHKQAHVQINKEKIDKGTYLTIIDQLVGNPQIKISEKEAQKMARLAGKEWLSNDLNHHLRLSISMNGKQRVLFDDFDSFFPINFPIVGRPSDSPVPQPTLLLQLPSILDNLNKYRLKINE